MPLLQRRLPVVACLLSFLGGCGSDYSPTQPSAAAVSSAAPSTPTPGFGAVEGRITDAVTADPVAGVRIDAVSGATSFSVTSNASGAFRMDLPPGTARVRATKEGYVAYDREHTVQSGPMTLEIRLAKIPAAPLPPMPIYTLTGLVIDLQGNPIANATAYAYCCDSPVDGVVGRSSTDAAGRFTLMMTTTRFPGNVSVEKTGYQQTRAPVAPFAPGSTGNITIAVARYVSYVLLPVPLRVGQTVPMPARFELDNGSFASVTAASLTSSNLSVIGIDRSYIKGIAPGVAIITGADEGLTGSVSLTVDPW